MTARPPEIVEDAGSIELSSAADVRIGFAGVFPAPEVD